MRFYFVYTHVYTDFKGACIFWLFFALAVTTLIV